MVRSQPNLLKSRPEFVERSVVDGSRPTAGGLLSASEAKQRENYTAEAPQTPLLTWARKASPGGTQDRRLIGRVEPLAKLRESVTSKDWCGSVVVGIGGIGKTALVRQALHDLPSGTTRHYLRGTALTRQTPYGILGLLLGSLRLPAGEVPSLTAVLQTVGRSLAAATSGGPPVIVVDNAETADQWSALALAELARSGAIRLVLVCRRINDTVQEFAQLWRTGQLLRIDVQALDCGETREFLAQDTGGSCSLAAATRLWQESSGNPLHLKALIAAEVGDGALSRHDGVWTWQEQRMSTTVPSGVGHLTRLMNADAGNWEILEAVSLAGAMPVALLMELYPAEEVDALQESGDLAFVGSGKSVVILAHPVIARLLPKMVAADQRQRLLVAKDALRQRKNLTDPVSEGGANLASPSLWGAGQLAASAEMTQDVAVLDDRSNAISEVTAARDLLHCHAEHAQWAARHAASLALAGNQDEALVLAAALTARMALSSGGSVPTPSAPPVAKGLMGPLMTIFTVSGEWTVLDELMEACQIRGSDADQVDCGLQGPPQSSQSAVASRRCTVALHACSRLGRSGPHR